LNIKLKRGLADELVFGTGCVRLGKTKNQKTEIQAALAESLGHGEYRIGIPFYPENGFRLYSMPGKGKAC
jgi:hypothetical protein